MDGNVFGGAAPALVLHAAAWFMAGLVWFVQLVHYPLMGDAGAAGFARYEQRRRHRTTWIVAPAMMLQGDAGRVAARTPGGAPAQSAPATGRDRLSWALVRACIATAYFGGTSSRIRLSLRETRAGA